jgi:hypothetical protein
MHTLRIFVGWKAPYHGLIYPETAARMISTAVTYYGPVPLSWMTIDQKITGKIIIES